MLPWVASMSPAFQAGRSRRRRRRLRRRRYAPHVEPAMTADRRSRVASGSPSQAGHARFGFIARGVDDKTMYAVTAGHCISGSGVYAQWSHHRAPIGHAVNAFEDEPTVDAGAIEISAASVSDELFASGHDDTRRRYSVRSGRRTSARHRGLSIRRDLWVVVRPHRQPRRSHHDRGQARRPHLVDRLPVSHGRQRVPDDRRRRPAGWHRRRHDGDSDGLRPRRGSHEGTSRPSVPPGGLWLNDPSAHVDRADFYRIVAVPEPIQGGASGCPFPVASVAWTRTARRPSVVAFDSNDQSCHW